MILSKPVLMSNTLKTWGKERISTRPWSKSDRETPSHELTSLRLCKWTRCWTHMLDLRCSSFCTGGFANVNVYIVANYYKSVSNTIEFIKWNTCERRHLVLRGSLNVASQRLSQYVLGNEILKNFKCMVELQNFLRIFTFYQKLLFGNWTYSIYHSNLQCEKIWHGLSVWEVDVWSLKFGI